MAGAPCNSLVLCGLQDDARDVHPRRQHRTCSSRQEREECVQMRARLADVVRSKAAVWQQTEDSTSKSRRGDKTTGPPGGSTMPSRMGQQLSGSPFL